MKHFWFPGLFVLILTVACRVSSTAAPSPRPNSTAVSSLSDSISLPSVSPVVTQVATRSTPLAPPIPASTIFRFAWDDRSIFATGLLNTEQNVLAQLPGASVYHLDLTIAPDMTHVSGKEAVRYTNTEGVALAEIYFRLFPNLFGGSSTVSNLMVNGVPGAPELSMQNTTLRVPLPQPLSPGEQGVITMDFAVTVPITAGNNYAAFAYLNDILALPHSYPMIAAYDDSGWHVEIPPTYGDVVYADTSFYVVRVTAPEDLVLVASGVVIGTEHNSNTQTVTFAAGPMRDFYLVGSKEYEKTSQKVGKIIVNSYAPADVASEAKIGLGYVTAAIKTYSARFGPYPFTELDLVGTPTSAGGIEYPGAIVVALGLYDSTNPFFEVAAAHEAAHQWFYSLIGNDQVDSPWLDESLTQYVTWLYFQDNHGAAGATNFERGLEDYWNQAGKADIPIGMPVSAYTEKEYGAIIYGRGPLFFNALAKKMGQQTFNVFLRDYVQMYRWGIATPKEFKSLAEDECQCDLTPLFETWVFKQ